MAGLCARVEPLQMNNFREKYDLKLVMWLTQQADKSDDDVNAYLQDSNLYEKTTESGFSDNSSSFRDDFSSYEEKLCASIIVCQYRTVPDSQRTSVRSDCRLKLARQFVDL